MKPEEIRWKKFVIVQMKGKKLHKTKKKKNRSLWSENLVPAS